MKNHEPNIVLLIVILIVIFLALAVAPDVYRAYTGTKKGDRWRLFLYHQTARWYGVPAALDKYGVKPKPES